MNNIISKLSPVEIFLVIVGLIYAVGAFSNSLASIKKNLVDPIFNKTKKIQENEEHITELSTIPARVAKLEEYNKTNYADIRAINEVNVLMMEALLALVRNKTKDGDVKELADVEKKLDGFLVGKVGK